MIRSISILVFCLLPVFLHGLYAQQRGCTDPRAINYKPAAEINDGSCYYPQTHYKPKAIIRQLPLILQENSGMILWNDLLWFHNDSRNEAAVYAFDTLKNNIVKTVNISNAKNRDWEDICHDSLYIYIGDFGNNAGNRKDLKIYRVLKSAISDSGEANILADIISFTYSDQYSFEQSRDHNFDCEAFIPYGDSLYLFSKNWKDNKTKLYSLPKLSGNYTATLLDSFDVGGLITSVSQNKDSSILVLLGYDNYKPFVLLLFDFPNNCFFQGNKRRIDMPSLNGFQTEALSFTQNERFIFSSEKTQVTPNRLFESIIGKWTQHFKSANIEKNTQPIQLFSSLKGNEYFIWIGKPPKRHINYFLLNSNLEKIHKGKIKTHKNESFFSLSFPQLNPGEYIFFIPSKKLNCQLKFIYGK